MSILCVHVICHTLNSTTSNYKVSWATKGIFTPVVNSLLTPVKSDDGDDDDGDDDVQLHICLWRVHTAAPHSGKLLGR